MMNRVTVLYHVNGQYGEFVAKSATLTEQEMVDKMIAEAKPGVNLYKFLGFDGQLTPTPVGTINWQQEEEKR